MLNKQVMISGFRKAARQSEKTAQDAKRQIKKLKADIGHSLTHEQFQDAAKDISENAMGDLTEKTIDRYADAVAKYLNGMVDPTGDSLLNPFQRSDTRPLIEALKQPNENARAVPPVDARVQSVWASYFPLQFALNTPPPGSIRETSAIGAPVPIGTMAPVITGNKNSHEDAFKKLADIIHAAASQITVTIQHVISTPSGPAPGPPITGPVQ